MRILLTISDRDLLKALETLLEADGHTLATAFDGVQALAKIDDAPYDLAVVDDSVSRVEIDTLAADIARSGIPVVLLTGRNVTRGLLEKAMPVSAFLPYPFEPDTLKSVLADVAGKAGRADTFRVGDTAAESGKFRLRRGQGAEETTVCVTAKEMDILKAVAAEAALPDNYNDAIKYIGALNTKFGRLGSDRRIAYLPGKGYRLVTDND